VCRDSWIFSTTPPNKEEGNSAAALIKIPRPYSLATGRREKKREENPSFGGWRRRPARLFNCAPRITRTTVYTISGGRAEPRCPEADTSVFVCVPPRPPTQPPFFSYFIHPFINAGAGGHGGRAGSANKGVGVGGGAHHIHVSSSSGRTRRADTTHGGAASRSGIYSSHAAPLTPPPSLPQSLLLLLPPLPFF